MVLQILDGVSDALSKQGMQHVYIPLLLVAVAAWAHQVGLLERLDQKSGSALDRHGVVGEEATPIDIDGESFLLSHLNSLPDKFHHVAFMLHVQSNTHLNHVTYIHIRICWHATP